MARYVKIKVEDRFRKSGAPEGPFSLKRILLGNPLATSQTPHQRISKVVALAVFSSDALSSVAYATEEILLALSAGGIVAMSYGMPVAACIAALLLIVAVSYRQTIHAYPSGGGAYIVAKENLGQGPGLTAAAALLVDYVMTVAVSIAAGVAAITSAFPSLYDHRVMICVGLVAFITLANLRGIRESGALFAPPDLLLHLQPRDVDPGGTLPHRVPGHGAGASGPLRGDGGAGSPPPASGLRFGVHGPHRRGGHQQRRPRLPGARVPERLHHPGVDGGHPGLPLRGDLHSGPPPGAGPPSRGDDPLPAGPRAPRLGGRSITWCRWPPP